MDDPRIPPLTISQRRLLARGIGLFNAGDFFECHEVLEEAWLVALGGQRVFLQGFIQAAAALHHLRRNNLVGAGSLLAAGIEKLSRFGPRYENVDVSGFLCKLELLRTQIDLGRILKVWEPPLVDLLPTADSHSESGNDR